MYLRPVSPSQTQNRTRLKLAAVEPEPGTYALVLFARTNGLVWIGRLGRLRLQSGFYVYVGSAHGSGGVRGRLTHHFEPSIRPHWHIDYLRRHTSLEEVWYCYDRVSREHQWAQCLGTRAGASIPLAGFGASDCQCESHLYFFRSRPSRNAFVRSLRTSDQKHPQVGLLSLAMRVYNRPFRSQQGLAGRMQESKSCPPFRNSERASHSSQNRRKKGYPVGLGHIHASDSKLDAPTVARTLLNCNAHPLSIWLCNHQYRPAPHPHRI